MISRDGNISLFSFAASVLVAIVPELLLRLEYNVYDRFIQNIWLIYLFQFVFLNLLVILTFRGFTYQVVVRSVLLGYAFGIGIVVSIVALPSWQTFGMYMTVLSMFHYSEFLAIAWTNPESLSIDSFILNHSLAYGIAASASWLEFLVERYYFPELKEPSSISYIGLIMCISGEIFRKLAMLTAKHNFHHVIQSSKNENHVLVTHSVYGLCRHPSYVGWFYWSIGTQLILQNPFCLLAYALTSWIFFRDRIYIEEITLLNFFGEEYVNYQKRVGTGLPFISGYKVNL